MLFIKNYWIVILFCFYFVFFSYNLLVIGMNQNEYVRLSLELHLFFDRIMKEHSFFLEAGFMEKDKELKQIARDFQKTFGDILDRVVDVANGNVSREFLAANEMVTKNTLEAENKTSNLAGIIIDTDITSKELGLKSGDIVVTNDLLNIITTINRQTLPVIENIIHFKNDVLNRVLACDLYTTNYPLLITHIMNEAKMYHKLLTKVMNRESFTFDYFKDQELFWNNIMMEHAEFIRGLLDPSEASLITSADQFANAYEEIIANYSNSPSLTSVSLDKTIEFRDFKIAGEEGILNCKVKSIIIPLLADHVVREANHFIRILRTPGNNTRELN